MGDLLERQAKAQKQLTHLQSVREKRVEQLSAAEEAVAKQETYIVELAEQVRVAKLATNTPPEYEDGAESAVDSDLKSQADESMAGEHNETIFLKRNILREKRGEWLPKPKLLRLLRKISVKLASSGTN